MVNFRFHPTAWIFGAVLAYMICLGGMSKTGMADTHNDPSVDKTFLLLDLFGEAFNKVRQEYVEDVSDEDLIEAAIQGMLAKLDPPFCVFGCRKLSRATNQFIGGIWRTWDSGHGRRGVCQGNCPY